MRVLQGKNLALVRATLPLLMLLLLWGCDPAFEPLQENDRYFFSIYGYLDASADTQWVRVMPVHEELFYTNPASVDVVVRLEHPESGQRVVMNDSLFHYGNGVYAWNFWTTVNLEPEQTWRLSAERSDGSTSQATVTLPGDFRAPRVYVQPTIVDDDELEYDWVYIDDEVDPLVDVQLIYCVREAEIGEHLFSISRLESVTRTFWPPIEYRLRVRGIRDHVRNNLGSIYPIERKQVFVAKGGPDWVDFLNLDQAVIALPEGISNVENGVGYLGGIVSKTVPFKSCYKEGTEGEGGELVPCPTEQRVTGNYACR